MLIHVPPGAPVLAMDVHKYDDLDGGARAGLDARRWSTRSRADDESVRRLVGRFEDPARVWACYEAGPTGYELARRAAGGRGCAAR